MHQQVLLDCLQRVLRKRHVRGVIRADEHQLAGPATACQDRDEIHGEAVRPMQILEHQQQRLVGGGRLQRLTNLAQHAFPMACKRSRSSRFKIGVCARISDTIHHTLIIATKYELQFWAAPELLTASNSGKSWPRHCRLRLAGHLHGYDPWPRVAFRYRRRMEKTVGTMLYRNILREYGRVNQPKLIQDPAVKRTVLQMLESATRGIARLDAVTKRLDAKTVEALLAKLQAPPLGEISDMKTLQHVVFGLEELAGSDQYHAA